MATAKSSTADKVAMGFAIVVAILVVVSFLVRRVVPRVSETFYRIGWASFQRSDYAGAIGWFNAAIFLKRDYTHAYIACGRARLNALRQLDHRERPSSNPDYDLAIKDFDAAIRLDPAEPDPYVERGRALWMEGHDDRAFQSYDQALQISPKYFDAYSARASAHVERKEFDLAVVDDTQRIQLAPGSAKAYIDRAYAYSNSGKSNLAILDEDRAIGLAPKFSVAWNNRCWDRAIVGKLAEAREDCEHVLDLYPHYSRALDSLGFVYLKLKNPTMAIANYNAALAEAPKEPASLYGRGVAEFQKGNADAGSADLDAAKAIKPDIADDFAKWGVPSPSPRAHPKP